MIWQPSALESQGSFWDWAGGGARWGRGHPCRGSLCFILLQLSLRKKEEQSPPTKRQELTLPAGWLGIGVRGGG